MALSMRVLNLRRCSATMLGLAALIAAQCGPDKSKPYPPGSTTCPTMPHNSAGGTGGRPAPGGTGSGGNMGTACETRPCAGSLTGDVGLVTVSGTDARTGNTFSAGENIYGPFEAGFSSRQDNILKSLGCTDPSKGYVNGGIDTFSAEQMVAAGCNTRLPRIVGNEYISLLDECGGHTNDYHFHERLNCLYNENAAGHSTQVGKEKDAINGVTYYLYGRFESTGVEPQLDACGGHFGLTPDSPNTVIYHYHVQLRVPFTIGCYGPDKDSGGEEILVTLEKCKSLYPECSDGKTEMITRVKEYGANDAQTTETVNYNLWCPCYDGAGSNMGTATLPVFANGNVVKKIAATATTATPTTTTTMAPVNCVGTFGAYGACSNGIKTRSYNITTAAAYGGTECAHLQGATEQDVCMDSDCTGSWSGYSTCTNGEQTNTYTLTENNTNCTIANQTAVTKTCGTPCSGSWSAWDTCVLNSTICYFDTTGDSVAELTSDVYHTKIYDDAAKAKVGWSAEGCPANATAGNSIIAAGNTGRVHNFVPGKQSRTFTVATAATGGGKQCGPVTASATTESRQCEFSVVSPTTAPPTTTQAPQTQSVGVQGGPTITTTVGGSFDVDCSKTQAQLMGNTGFTKGLELGMKAALSNVQSVTVTKIKCDTCGTCRRNLEEVQQEDDQNSLRRLASKDMDIDYLIIFLTDTAKTAGKTAVEGTNFASTLKSALTVSLATVPNIGVLAVASVSAPVDATGATTAAPQGPPPSASSSLTKFTTALPLIPGLLGAFLS